MKNVLNTFHLENFKFQHSTVKKKLLGTIIAFDIYSKIFLTIIKYFPFHFYNVHLVEMLSQKSRSSSLIILSLVYSFDLLENKTFREIFTSFCAFVLFTVLSHKISQ